MSFQVNYQGGKREQERQHNKQEVEKGRGRDRLNQKRRTKKCSDRKIGWGRGVGGEEKESIHRLFKPRGGDKGLESIKVFKVCSQEERRREEEDFKP